MFPVKPLSACLNPVHPDCLIFDERMKDPDGIGSSPDTGDDDIRKPSFCCQNLLFCLITDDPLQVSDQSGVWVWSGDCSDEIMGVKNTGYPVTECLIHGVLECPGPACDRDDPCPHHIHPGNIEGLAGNVHFTHEHVNLKAKDRSGDGGCNPVLPCTGLCNEPFFTHVFCEECLTQGVVHLMGP